MGDVDTRVADPPRPSNPGRTQTDPHGPGQTTTDQNKPKAVEWGLRADTAIEFPGHIIGRLVHEPQGEPSEGDGEPRLVYLFVHTKRKASPDDHLDNEDDSSSNHPRLPKKVEKHPIHGVVRVPKPSSPTDEHHDYSYHGPPPNKASKSSSSGSSMASMTATGGAPVPNGSRGGSTTYPGGVPQGDGGPSSPTGSPSAPSLPSTSTQTFTDGSGTQWHRTGAPATPGGPVIYGPWSSSEAATSAGTSSQADQGFIAPQSPGFSQRTNSHRYDADRDVVGVLNSEKPEHYTAIYVTLNHKTSDEMEAGQWIVLDVVVATRDQEGLAPKTFYSCPVALGNDVTDRSNRWHQTTWKLTGFPTQAQHVLVYVVRRAMTLGGDFGAIVPATQNLYICSEILTYAGKSNAAASLTLGYGYNYGVDYGVEL